MSTEFHSNFNAVKDKITGQELLHGSVRDGLYRPSQPKVKVACVKQNESVPKSCHSSIFPLFIV